MLPINYGILINKALKVKINLLVYLIIISLNLYIISDIIIKYINYYQRGGFNCAYKNTGYITGFKCS